MSSSEAGQDVAHALAAFGIEGLTYRVFGRFALRPVLPPAATPPPVEQAPAPISAAPIRVAAALPDLDAALWAVPVPEPSVKLPLPRRVPSGRSAPVWQAPQAIAFSGLAERIAARTGQAPLPATPALRAAAEVLRLRWEAPDPASARPAPPLAADGVMFRRL